MNPELRQRAQQITRYHPNLMRLLFRNIKENLPFGIGEGKVKDVLAENIPEWIFDLNDSDLKEFMEALQHDPEFYRYLRFQLKVLENILYEEQ
jgi:hypothetical protein